jgi:hypothetical protein
MSQPVNSTQIDRKTPPKVTRKRRKLAFEDMEDVALLVIKYRMNETEACGHLEIRPHQWFLYKQRKGMIPKFEAIQNRIRAAQLANTIGAIDKAGEDREVEYVNRKGEVGTITKPGDWRAKAWIAERVLAPERFSDRQGQPQSVTNNIFTVDVSSIIERVYKAKAIDIDEVKSLPESTQLD